MNKYKVYYKYRDKKFQIEIEANNKHEAEDTVLNFIEIIAVKLSQGKESKDDKSFEDLFKTFFK